MKAHQIKPHLRVNVKHVKSVVDSATGELIDISVDESKYLTKDSEEFFLTWVGCFNVLESWDLTISDLQMFAHLVKLYASGQMFTITEQHKQELAVINKKSVSSFHKCTSVLLKKGLIYSLPNSKRVYKLNPRYIWKGSTSLRKYAIIELEEGCPSC